MSINQKLAKERNITKEHIDKINELHLLREKVGKNMAKAAVEELPLYDKRLDEIEYQLQDLWGFGRNPSFIKFWERPLCRCPTLDNQDNWPHGYYTYSSACPVHNYKFNKGE